MSSIYKDKADSESSEEIKRLEEKRTSYGWTQIDADRYNFLKQSLKT
ncbi:MAG: hypothetical protein ACUZ8E_06990 [Candidatus Anammoxibacter sp.]